MAPSSQTSTDAYQQQIEALRALTDQLIEDAWAEVDPKNPERSWGLLLAVVVAQMTSMQLMSVNAVPPFMRASLLEIGFKAPAVGLYLPPASQPGQPSRPPIAPVRPSQGSVTSPPTQVPQRPLEASSSTTEPLSGVVVSGPSRDVMVRPGDGHKVIQGEVVYPVETEIVPQAFIGAAADGRDLESLLALPGESAQFRKDNGEPPAQAALAGLNQLKMISRSEISDVRRAAEQVEIVQRPAVTKYVRVVNLPCCSRCLLLAGRLYKHDADFSRHPGCDCSARVWDGKEDPRLTDDEINALLREGKIKGVNKADVEAITEHGADLYRVVNARRGDGVEPVRWQLGTAVRERGGIGRRIRLTPAGILASANGDRDEINRLLYKHGYIRKAPTQNP